MGFHWVSITVTSLRERSRVCATSTQQRLDGVPVRKIDKVNMIGVLSYPLQNHPPQATLESPRREEMYHIEDGWIFHRSNISVK